MMLSRCSRVFFLAICLAGFHNLLRSRAEAVALKPSAAPTRPMHPGKVVIELDFSPIDPPKTRGGHFKTNSFKSKAKKKGVTLQPITNKVSKRMRKVLQRKRKEKAADYQYDANSSYLSKETHYPSSESSEYPVDDDPVVKSCDPQVYNCKNAAELEKDISMLALDDV